MKRISVLIASAVLIGFLPTAHAATLIGGEQINRVWTLAQGLVGLVINASQRDRPAFRVLHPNGSVSAEIRGGGQAYFTGAVLINLGGVSGTGVTVDAGVALEVIGTASGRNLFASQSMTGTNIHAALRFSGAGLSDCDTASTSKLLWDAATKRFSCGSDASGTNTGNVLIIGDVRYLKKSGDTATGQLVVNITSGNFNTVGLKIINTLSGAHLHAERTLTSSGGAVIENQVVARSQDTTMAGLQAYGAGAGNQMFLSLNRGSDGYQFLDFSVESGVGVIMREGGAGSLKIRSSNPALQDASGNNFFSLVVGTGWTDGTTTNFSYIGSGTPGLWIQSTGGAYSRAAIRTPYFQITSLTPQFSAPVPGAMFEVLNDAATKTGAIIRGNLGQAAALLLLQNSASGTLFTIGNLGQMTIFNTGSLALQVKGTFTGAILKAQRTLASSGTLVWEGFGSGAFLHIEKNVTTSGSLIAERSVSGSTLLGFGLGSCSDANNSKVLYNNSTNQFTCGTDQTGAGALSFTTAEGIYVNQSGDTMTGALLVKANLSGSRLIVSGNANITGALLIVGNATTRGTLSGSRLVVSRNANISGSLLVKTSMSGQTIFGKRCPTPVSIELTASGSAITTGSGKLTWLVPRYLSGYSIAHFSAAVDQSGTTGLTRIGIRDVDKGKRSIFSTLPSIDSAETKTATAATSYVINTSNDDISGDDRLTFDILQVQTTAPKGLDINLELSCP